jgi:hypothetical protein
MGRKSHPFFNLDSRNAATTQRLKPRLILCLKAFRCVVAALREINSFDFGLSG